jgi:hypothetical protein
VASAKPLPVPAYDRVSFLISSLIGALLGSLAILATWIVLFAAFAGIGLLFRRAYRLREDADPDEWFIAFWVGFALVLLLLQVWHFARPVSAATLAIVLVAGASGLAVHRGLTRRMLTASFAKERRGTLTLVAVIALWAANRAMGANELYDSGMYHLPVVEWTKAQPVVPGLANLHGRLAFNGSGLLYAAMLDVGPWTGGASHLANGLVLLALTLQIVVRGARFARDGSQRRADNLFAMVLLPALVLAFMCEDVWSLMTDVPVTTVLFATGILLFSGLTTPAPDEQRRAHNFAATSLLLAAAVCLKLSAAVFATFALLLAFLVWRAPRPTESPHFQFGALAGALMLPAVLLATWIARGVILSGYPFYPIRLFAASVPWRVPEEQAAAEEGWIRMSARYLNTNQIGVGWDWLKQWLDDLVTRGDMFMHITLPFAIAGGAVVIALRTGRRRALVSAPAGRGWLLLVPLAPSVLFWVWSVPHARFAQAFFWLAAAISVALLYDARYAGTLDMNARLVRRIVIAPVALSGLLAMGHCVAGVERDPENRNAQWLLGTVLTLPSRDAWLPPPPTAKLARYATRSGLALWVPVKGNSCWRGPLPCTPHPAPNLRLRRKGDLKSGFVVDGAWQPSRWPNPWTSYLTLFRCQRAQSARPREERDRECLAKAQSQGTAAN